MTDIHAFDPDGTASPGAQTALNAATANLATREEVADATNGLATETYAAEQAAAAISAAPTALTTSYSLAQNFSNIKPRYITRLDVHGDYVMQAFGRDSKGLWYVTQVSGTSGDMTVARCDAGGRAIDSATLTGGGHGSPWGLEEVNGDVYMWVWWDSGVNGAHNVFRRWKYTPGATVAINDPTVEALPDFFSNVTGFQFANVTISQRLDLIAINVRTETPDRYDTVQLRRLSDYKNGVDNIIAQLPPIENSPNGAFQGLAVTAEHCYILRGMGGSWPQSPHVDQYQWSDGAKAGTIDASTLPYGAVDTGGKAEAEGMHAWWDAAGRLSLLFGIETGANSANQHNVFSISPTDFQDDTGIGASIQRLYSPLKWVNVPLVSGFAYRGSGYELQVARDPNGMVHIRGGIAATGFSTPSVATTFAKVPIEYIPASEVRWLAFASGRGQNTFGGWISASTGDVVLQNDVDNPRVPARHFNIIAQPWQAKS